MEHHEFLAPGWSIQSLTYIRPPPKQVCCSEGSLQFLTVRPVVNITCLNIPLFALSGNGHIGQVLLFYMQPVQKSAFYLVTASFCQDAPQMLNSRTSLYVYLMVHTLRSSYNNGIDAEFRMVSDIQDYRCRPSHDL